jgi:hypothetical protein
MAVSNLCAADSVVCLEASQCKSFAWDIYGVASGKIAGVVEDNSHARGVRAAACGYRRTHCGIVPPSDT